jgi:glycosyltransferase involved in cell wall biosynthesis
MYGDIIGRFFLPDHLGLKNDDTPSTLTVSELVETYRMWPAIVHHFKNEKETVQLYTMFETSDVHPDIIESMKKFDKVIVPFPYLANILARRGVNAVPTNFYTSEIIRKKPLVVPKKRDPDRIIFLYVGTNDIRKNVTSLVRTFAKAALGTQHLLIVKTNTPDQLLETDNIRIVTDKMDFDQLIRLYNLCDYIISFTRGEGVGLPMLEADYFGKPIIAHDQGVFTDVKNYVKVPWHVLPTNEVPIDLTKVPPFLHEVFYGTWWEVDEEQAIKVIKDVFGSLE